MKLTTFCSSLISGNSCYLFIVLLLMSFSGMSQTPGERRYVILTVERTFERSFEGPEIYYWIIQTDSIRRRYSSFSPLLLSGFSNANLDSSCVGIPIDPFTIRSTDTDYKKTNEYYAELERLRKLLSSGRKQILLLSKKWRFVKNKEVVKFYLTPVKGKFCSSAFAKPGPERTGYIGHIFLPYASFVIDELFWASPQFDMLTHDDFSRIRFDAIR